MDIAIVLFNNHNGTFVVESKEDILMTLVSFGVVSLKLFHQLVKLMHPKLLRLYSFAVPIVQKELDVKNQ